MPLACARSTHFARNRALSVVHALRRKIPVVAKQKTNKWRRVREYFGSDRRQSDVASWVPCAPLNTCLTHARARAAQSLL